MECYAVSCADHIGPYSCVSSPQGFLEGVKTKDKAILKMIKMGFKYPGADKNTVTDISLYCTLSSRVVVHGANGAGKSTMIKV